MDLLISPGFPSPLQFPPNVLFFPSPHCHPHLSTLRRKKTLIFLAYPASRRKIEEMGKILIFHNFKLINACFCYQNELN